MVTMKRLIGSDGYRIDSTNYYIATHLKDFRGLPPVASCNHDHPKNGGSGGWHLLRPGISAGFHMTQNQCVNFPEIYTEYIRIISLINEVKK